MKLSKEKVQNMILFLVNTSYLSPSPLPKYIPPFVDFWYEKAYIHSLNLK
jgi:hypothetical protein